MPTTKRDVNEYLFYEFGLDGEASASQRIADNWPFELTELGPIKAGGKSWQVFGFAEGEESYFALANGALDFLPTAGMTVDFLAMQLDGECWLQQQDPVSLEVTEGSESETPSVPVRRAAIAALAATLECGPDPEVLEGLYLKRRKQYLALVHARDAGACHLVGDRLRLRSVPFPRASGWRRLAVGVGKLLRAGRLS